MFLKHVRNVKIFYCLCKEILHNALNMLNISLVKNSKNVKKFYRLWALEHNDQKCCKSNRKLQNIEDSRKFEAADDADHRQKYKRHQKNNNDFFKFQVSSFRFYRFFFCWLFFLRSVAQQFPKISFYRFTVFPSVRTHMRITAKIQ